MNKTTEKVSFVDEVFGGDAMRDETHSDDHSRTVDEGTDSENDAKSRAEEEADEEIGTNPEDDSDSFEDDDSDAEEDDLSDDGGKSDAESKTDDKSRQNAQEIDSTKLKQEIENLQKRLHDTQAAMHKATTDRAALKKELDELKAKKDNDDDWFSQSDSEREKELEADLKKADEDIARQQEEQDELKKEEAAKVWDEAAAPVIKEHPDFEKVMYGELVPLLDSKTGNQYVIAEWGKLQDKSPASAYAFAKKMLDFMEFQRDPQAYKAKLLKSNKHNESFEDDVGAPRGKDGLDMLNSADVASASPEQIGSFVDACGLFG